MLIGIDKGQAKESPKIFVPYEVELEYGTSKY
jgi:hypothetical protein